MSSSSVTSEAPTSQDGDGALTVVIDVGSGFVRGGVAGEDNPRCEFPTIVTSPNESQGTSCPEPQQMIDRGVVKDWEGVENLLRSLYNDLHVSFDSQHALLLTRHVHDPVGDAERFVQVGLESLGASAVYLGVQPVLALYANGSTDGVVVDCGEGVTQIVPVYQGYGVTPAIQRQDLAGRDVALRLQTLLANRRPDIVSADLHTAQAMKEKLCYVSPNFDQETEARSNKVARPFTLPNGDVITVGEERFCSPEILFQPSMIGSEYLGLAGLLDRSISACPIDVRGQLYEKVIMSGGTTKTPGICRRLLKDLSALSPNRRVKVVAAAGRQHSVWRGGSVLASLPSFTEMCVSKAEYQEHGGAIVRKKFLWT